MLFNGEKEKLCEEQRIGLSAIMTGMGMMEVLLASLFYCTKKSWQDKQIIFPCMQLYQQLEISS